ncbi:Chromosome partitioning ATPase, Mrp family, contains Fe-S cluster [Alkalispirochaeta americana]|uniref:Iron-sulfur cluster carrier protein n=2 Tax=Alkalispirochaeta americana TaxID=159291 RepID=A0A1N6NA65_9SPIO|nr:Chromosome partitioning ATPase, Mrp family, contains Fe-S cluster [Alkalispirochaeta americana]
MEQSDNPQDIMLARRLERIRFRVAVMSGKGGVGKSTISANLAWLLAQGERETGLLDTDLHGPNLPLMLGVEKACFTPLGEDEIEPVPVAPHLRLASVGNIGHDPRKAFIWRGPMKLGVIRQFLACVVWSDLDYLVIDTPPGTGDEVLTIGQYAAPVTGAVIVTTPQDVAVLDARKSVDFALQMNIPVIGIVENMSDGEGMALFGHGGGERAARELSVPFLGRVSLDPRLVRSGDTGRPFVADHPETATGRELAGILDRVMAWCEESPEDPSGKD